MNTDPHNLMNPLREKFPYFIRHEKLYRMIHLQLMKKWFQYFVLFFIIGSICSIIYGSFEESGKLPILGYPLLDGRQSAPV